MIDFLRGWVKNIVILVVFISFLEIILPSSNMKRYINMIIGLLIIIVLLNPFINLITQEFNIEKEVFSNIMESNNINQNLEKEFSDLQRQQAISLYKESVKKEILDLINIKTKYTIDNLSIDIIEDTESEDFGKIVKVNLVIGEKIESSKDKKINVKVSEVEEVSVEINKNNISKSDDNSTEFNELRKLISDSYRIPESNINIMKKPESN